MFFLFFSRFLPFTVFLRNEYYNRFTLRVNPVLSRTSLPPRTRYPFLNKNHVSYIGFLQNPCSFFQSPPGVEEVTRHSCPENSFPERKPTRDTTVLRDYDRTNTSLRRAKHRTKDNEYLYQYPVTLQPHSSDSSDTVGHEDSQSFLTAYCSF